MKDVEILVHINAPGGSKDDQLYRKIARQVAEFKSTARFEVIPSDDCVTAEGWKTMKHQVTRFQVSGKTLGSSQGNEGIDSKELVKRSWGQKRSSFDDISKAGPVRYSTNDLSSASVAMITLDETLLVPPSIYARIISRSKWLRDILQNQSFSSIPTAFQVIREIKPSERGYWQIAITVACDGAHRTSISDVVIGRRHVWTVEEFHSFWTGLSQQLKVGNLGLVSLHRTRLVNQCLARNVLLRVRLYCWGQVVFDMFSALRWASGGLMELISARWIGADGSTVILHPVNDGRYPDTMTYRQTYTRGRPPKSPKFVEN